MKVDDFDFDLPAGFIAQRPAAPRDAARLLRVAADGPVDKKVMDLPDLLEPGDLLVVNNTRVIPTRLEGRRGGDGAKIEVTLHKMDARDAWLAFSRPARKLETGSRIDFPGGFSAEVVAKGAGGEVTLRFDQSGPELMMALKTHGAMPLPPYIKRDGPDGPRDKEDYQTLFAVAEGAVAAPTAGLHFTPRLLEALDARGVKRCAVTLHIGAGTFLPVRVDDTANHVMHAEWGEVTKDAAAAIASTRASGGRVVAVGTTSLRLIEKTNGRPFAGDIDIFISPGYRFQVADMLLTNFHLPRSTLFMLVCAFSGLDRMKAAYGHAMAANYRFYSYGDCCLLDRLEDQ